MSPTIFRERGYRFDSTKISDSKNAAHIEETTGQLLYEWRHLRRKLRVRAPKWFRQFSRIPVPEPHPLFRIVPGEVRDWEKRDGIRTRKGKS